MNEIRITLLFAFLVVIGSILITISFVINMSPFYIFIASFGGGMLIGTGLINLYLDWRLRRKWNKRFIIYRKKGE